LFVPRVEVPKIASEKEKEQDKEKERERPLETEPVLKKKDIIFRNTNYYNQDVLS